VLAAPRAQRKPRDRGIGDRAAQAVLAGQLDDPADEPLAHPTQARAMIRPHAERVANAPNPGEPITNPAILELYRREVTPELHAEIRKLWKRHSVAEDARDLPGLMSTLTGDCVYELAGTTHRWTGHVGATRFYLEMLRAFPDIHFELTDIVIGPQGVCEEAVVTATHRRPWLGVQPTGTTRSWSVVIFFPWDPERRLFRGEKIYTAGAPLPSP
jgi:predicted ester cyclase